MSHFKSADVIHNMLVIYANKGFEMTRAFYEAVKDKDEHGHVIVRKKQTLTDKIVYKISPEMRQDLTHVFEYLDSFDKLKRLDNESVMVDLAAKFNFDLTLVTSRNKLIFQSPEKARFVWSFYLKHKMVSLTDIVRNLSKLNLNGMLTDEVADMICQRLEEFSLLEKERLHPLNLFTALKIYMRGGNNKKKCKVNSKVTESFEKLFHASFKYVDKVDKPIAVCLNTWIHNKASLYKNTLVTPFQASVIQLLCSLHSQPNSKLYCMKDKLEEISIDKEMDFNKVVLSLWFSTVGSTNYSMPIVSASEKNLNFDSFIVYSNLEVNSKDSPLKELEKYRAKLKNPNVQLLNVSMIACNVQVASPNDKNTLDIIGFAHDSPQIILNYLKGLF